MTFFFLILGAPTAKPLEKKNQTKKTLNVTSAIANKAAFLNLHLRRRETCMQLCATDRGSSFGSLGMAVEYSVPFRIRPEKSSKKQITKGTFWMLCHQTAQECKRAGFEEFLGAVRWQGR